MQYKYSFNRLLYCERIKLSLTVESPVGRFCSSVKSVPKDNLLLWGKLNVWDQVILGGVPLAFAELTVLDQGFRGDEVAKIKGSLAMREIIQNQVHGYVTPLL